MRDKARELEIRSNGSVSVPAAGYTGNSDLLTGWMDISDAVGPVTVRAHVESDASLSGTFSIDHATSAAGAGSATVSDDADFPGGRESQGVNATGGHDFAVNTELNAAISYRGDRSFIRGRLRIANASSGAVAKSASVAVIKVPQVAQIR